MATGPTIDRRYEAGRGFLERAARPLDVALFRHAPGQGGADYALEALADFQNPDGGFGYGLEPDIQSPASSAIAGSIGLRLLVRLGADAAHPMTAALGRWLEGAIDRELGVWPIIGPAVDEAPHAPWWSYSDDLAASWNSFRFNPTAEILALLYKVPGTVRGETVALVEEGLFRTLAETNLIEGAYDLKCAVRLAESPATPDDLREPLAALVRRSIAAHDAADEHLSVFDVAPTPASPFAAEIAPRLELALERLVGGQQDDGGWIPFWDWSFVDADAWERARRDWRGWLTREALETIAAWRPTATAR